MVPNRQNESSDPVLEGKKCNSIDTGQCASWLHSRGGSVPPNLWVQAQQPHISVEPWQAKMAQYRNVSLRGTGSFMSVFHGYRQLHLGRTTHSKALAPSRNSMELRSIHLLQPLQKPVIPQEQVKGQTEGRDFAKIFPDLKEPCLILFTLLLHKRFTMTSKLL